MQRKEFFDQQAKLDKDLKEKGLSTDKKYLFETAV